MEVTPPNPLYTRVDLSPDVGPDRGGDGGGAKPPMHFNERIWPLASVSCMRVCAGGRRGWRL